MNEYLRFLEQKKIKLKDSGKIIDNNNINNKLFDFQKEIVRWACKKGRAAIFADTGLGKTFMQIEWARLLGIKTLIVAPLSVSKQTINEAKKLDVIVNYSNDGKRQGNITITNYEQIHKFNEDDFDGIVLDESSILKAIDGKTRKLLTDKFRNTKYKLCCTATPAPNDMVEIGNHSDFLGVMSHNEMLSLFFIHDSVKTASAGWRLKKHGIENFYQWMVSWSMSIRLPSDIGFKNNGYILPELKIKPLWVETDKNPSDALFFMGLKGIQDRNRVRRITIDERVDAIAKLINNDNGNQWLLWCGLNDESKILSKTIKNSVEVKGDDSIEHKIKSIERFQEKEIKTLITKPKICGFGMNFQNCHNMAFIGLSDSWEAYYQCIRRSYRFGQKNPVNVYVVLSKLEREIFDNINRKEKEANIMTQNLIDSVKEYEKQELEGRKEKFTYNIADYEKYNCHLMLGDSAERIKEIKDNSIDLIIFSPPFLDLYTYSPTERDLGNSKNSDDFFKHFNFIIKELKRVIKPGRNICIHVSQVPSTKVRDGFIGIKDFRGDVIRAFQEEKLIYHSETTIDKNPQAAAIRSKAKGLMFVQLEKDSIAMRSSFADYILVFKKDGENKHPVLPVQNKEMTRDDWITWAHPVWYNIHETDTLNAREAKDKEDEKHIVPLQLKVIERLIILYSNKNEIVFDPFMGIGSTGYEAIKHNRHFIGIELKESYYNASIKNMELAKSRKRQRELDL